MQLIADLTTEFRRRWGGDYEYLFLSGSGTMANEAVAFSFRGAFEVLHAEKEFAGRLQKQMAMHYYQWVCQHWMGDAWVQYETVDAKRTIPKEFQPPGKNFVDCVSGFPYYDPPAGVAAWTTVSSKQLAGYPVCSIVAVHKDAVQHLRPASDYSILNLSRYVASQANNLSPHTPSIPLLAHLRERVQELDLTEFRSWVDERRGIVLDALGDAVEGEGPVLNIVKPVVKSATAERFGLYKNPAGHHYQLFLYSSPEVDMAKFVKELVA